MSKKKTQKKAASVEANKVKPNIKASEVPVAVKQKPSKAQTESAKTEPQHRVESSVPSPEKAEVATVAPTPIPAPAPAPAPSPAPVKAAGRGLGWLALLISLLALAAGGYAAYQTTLSGHVTSGQLDGMSERVKLVATDQVVLKSSLGEVESRLKQVDQSLNEGLKKVDAQLLVNSQSIGSVKSSSASTMKSLKGDLTERIGGWKLDEVRSLLMLVGQQLRWTGDVRSAIRGLSNADQSLAQMNDGSLESVRSVLAKEVSALRAVTPVDVTRVHNQLGVLSDEIKQLPFLQERMVSQAPKAEQPTAKNISEPEPKTESADSGNWLSTGKSLISGIGSSLGSMVVVDNIDTTPEPALDAQARFVVSASLQLRLQEAQIALLKGQSAAYHSAMSAAKKWVGEYYAVDTSKVGSWLQELNGLAAVSTQLNVPDVSGSLIALDKAIQARK